MDKMIVRALILTVLLSFLAFMPGTVWAQNALEPTQIVVGAPTQSTLGDAVTVQAVLADSKGHPIPQAVVYFTTQTKFLSTSDDVVLAQAITNANGQAVAEFTNDFSGTVSLNAEFRGDTQYAPSNATTQIKTSGDGQVYFEHVGVDIPGLNVPPVSAQSQGGISGFIQSLWPAMNSWPIALVLFIVWSMYLLAVRFVFRIAALGDEPKEHKAPTNPEPGRES